MYTVKHYYCGVLITDWDEAFSLSKDEYLPPPVETLEEAQQLLEKIKDAVIVWLLTLSDWEGACEITRAKRLLSRFSEVDSYNFFIEYCY